ncbi:MAG: 2,3-bisphosphoglycerate-independent phosphoglycerate mutase [Denitrovibrio sp.]|nr:MAG: 2,3-bisphosphoglycerate-independent phosphoglycerate mutase [Denitrovibrio sp.]
MTRQKLILLILDGWGLRDDEDNNAIKISGAPNFHRLLAECPHTKLNASEEEVGLPKGQMGNSEVGHTNIGAGRIVYQDFLKITKSIETGDIEQNVNLIKFFNSIKDDNGNVHFFGLLSDGGVHSHIKHLKGLIKAAKNAGVNQAYLHAFMDGRDTPPNSGKGHMEDIVNFMSELGYGKVATVSGRYYPMDRDQRWERTKLGYDAVRNGIGLSAPDGVTAVQNGYDRGETDEFIKPTVIDNTNGNVKDGDGVFFFNFRADRARQLTRAFIMDDFDGFQRGAKPEVHFITLTFYDSSFSSDIAFAPQVLTNILGEVISKNGMTQLRIAETEKYAHVTYFFNGGEEKVFEGEKRALIESPKEVATYDLKPSMSIYKVTERFKQEIDSVDVVIMNFANPDMVGHSGVLEAAVSACRAVDECLGEVIKVADEHNAILCVTADHGNAEQMWDYKTNQPHTAHTLNPVPFIVYNHNCKLKSKTGKLADIAPTILKLLGADQPAEMTGVSLLENA